MEVTNSSDAGRTAGRHNGTSAERKRQRRLSRTILLTCLAAVLVSGIAAAAWLGSRASIIKNELEASSQLVPVLKDNIAGNKQEEANATVARLRGHTAAAREAAGDPLWTLASAVPGIGENFSAIAEVSRSADDVSTLGVAPLVKVFESLNWDSLLPSSGGTDLGPIRSASPSVSAAAHAVRASAERLSGIDADTLWPQVAEPLRLARQQLQTVTGDLDAAASVAKIAPGMMGADGQRSYLLMIQNNAEARASGGIPGALAVLTLDKGRLTLGAQSSTADFGIMSQILPVDPEQQQIYSPRLGMYLQDVNLTPDFPTAASTAQAMWEKKTGQHVDGVVSIDPVALGYVLDATGPVKVTGPDLLALTNTGLPAELTGKNIVQTLLSDVYAKISRPQLQDVYFAGVAREVFAALSNGKGESKNIINGLSHAAAEGRVLLWSGSIDEQSVIGAYPLSGAISGPSVAPAQFGVYFNDGTGAKMDYYVKRSVQLVKECPANGYQQTKIRVTSTNTAPADAAKSLPAYVTGAGDYGVPAGSVQTNVIAYGPVQADVETASVDGKKAGFAAHRHANRPVGSVTVALAPGQSSTVEFSFGRIVQHAEPTVVVTPTVQPVEEVVLAPENAVCETSK